MVSPTPQPSSGVRSASVHDLDINAAMKSRNGRSKGRGKEGESDEETKKGFEKIESGPSHLKGSLNRGGDKKCSSPEESANFD